VGFIEGWFVDEDLRRGGVGGELVRAAESWARAQGCSEMASDCHLENEVSRLAHLALGYAEHGRVIQFCKRLGS
jgi:aminoglycoside 6'-N-acetyltransferase I